MDIRSRDSSRDMRRILDAGRRILPLILLDTFGERAILHAFASHGPRILHFQDEMMIPHLSLAAFLACTAGGSDSGSGLPLGFHISSNLGPDTKSPMKSAQIA